MFLDIVRVSLFSLGGDQLGQGVHLPNGVGRGVHGLQFEHGAFREVAAFTGFPFVVLLDQNSPGEPEEGGGVGEDADDVGAAFDLFVHPLQWVGGPDLPLVPRGEGAEGEQVVSGVVEQRGDLRVGAAEHCGDLLELGDHVVLVGLGEDGADD